MTLDAIQHLEHKSPLSLKGNKLDININNLLPMADMKPMGFDLTQYEIVFEDRTAPSTPTPDMSARAFAALGEQKLKENKPEEADELLKLALDMGIFHTQPAIAADALFNLGVGYSKQGHLDDALTAFSKVVDQKEINLDAARWSAGNIAAILTEKGKTVEAEKMFKLATELKDDPEFLVDILGSMAFRLIKMRHFKKGDSLFEQIQHYSSSAPGAVGRQYFYLGYCYNALGKFEKAEKFYLHAISLKEHERSFAAYAAAGLGELYSAQGQNDEAEKMYQLALDCDLEEFFPKLAAIIAFNLARMKHDRGVFDEAEDLYSRVINLKKENPEAAVNASYALRVLEEQIPGDVDDEVQDHLKKFSTSLSKADLDSAKKSFFEALYSAGITSDNLLNLFENAIFASNSIIFPTLSSKSKKKSLDSEVVRGAEKRAITPIDLKKHRRTILKQAREGVHFVIERRGKPMASLGPPSSVEDAKSISSTALDNDRGRLLEKARDGSTFVIESRGKQMAILGPPPKEPYRTSPAPFVRPSPEEAEKLKLIADLSLEELQAILDLKRKLTR